MRLVIDNKKHTFVPIQKFRTQFDIPDDFQMSHFEAKEWQGLGSIEGSGAALSTVKQKIIETIPEHIPLPALLTAVDEITEKFRREFTVANQLIGLRPVEVDFAVSGFYDVLQAGAYHLVELTHICRQDIEEVRKQFNFSTIYQTWLDDSVRVSPVAHSYVNGDQQLSVRVIYNIYGHIGLEVDVADQIYYVADTTLACPAANYMQELCSEVTQRLSEALTL